jgi:hypothetical protein
VLAEGYLKRRVWEGGEKEVVEGIGRLCGWPGERFLGRCLERWAGVGGRVDAGRNIY